MGLLDDLGKQILEAGAEAVTGGQTNQLAQGMMKLLNDQGGIEGLAQLFQQKGFGEIVSSWIGTGENLSINAQQLLSVLGHGQVAQLAQQAGLPADQGAAALAQLLPTLIDKLTPNGQVPAGNQLLEAGIGLLEAHFGGATGGR
jgi:uncharacterized protein YidB (DUF937 family)